MGDDGLFTPEQRENFKNAFDAFDENRDDLVSVDVLGKLIRAVGFNPSREEIEDMIEDVGEDTLDYDGFMYILHHHAREADPEGELIEAFRVFDKDGSGRLKTDQIRKILRNLNQPFTEDQSRELLAQAEIDEDDCIEYSEFVKVMLDF